MPVVEDASGVTPGLDERDFRAEHPRLWLRADQWVERMSMVEGAPDLRTLRDLLRDAADQMSIFNCGIAAGNIGRIVIDRVAVPAILSRLLPEPERTKYSDLAIRQLMAAVESRCFDLSDRADLVEAEYAQGIALGYDWLYSELGANQRQKIQGVLLEFIRHAHDRFVAGYWWTRNKSNWNSVCNSGFGLAALAVIHDVPDPKIIDVLRLILQTHDGRGSLAYGLDAYGPSGDWFEGPGYWAYATRYAVALMASLESARIDGSNMGLANALGFTRGSLYRRHVEGPTGLAFNYSDTPVDFSFLLRNGYNNNSVSFLSYIARALTGDEATRTRQLVADEIRDEISDGDIDAPLREAALHLIAHSVEAIDSVPPGPASARFSDSVYFRTSWEPSASWVGLLAGANDGSTHQQLDIGTFVFQADGVDWGVELGDDNRNYDEYGDAFRKRTVGHSTIQLDGQDQAKGDGFVDAWIETFASVPGAGFARINMTEAYAPWSVRSAHRGVALVGSPRTILLVHDHITRDPSAMPVELDWKMWTRSLQYMLSDGGRVIQLVRQDKKLRMYLLSPDSAVFRFKSHNTVSCDDDNDCEFDRAFFRYVNINFTAHTDTTLKILLVPESSEHFSKSLSEMQACLAQRPTNCIHSGAQKVLTGTLTSW